MAAARLSPNWPTQPLFWGKTPQAAQWPPIPGRQIQTQNQSKFLNISLNIFVFNLLCGGKLQWKIKTHSGGADQWYWARFGQWQQDAIKSWWSFWERRVRDRWKRKGWGCYARKGTASPRVWITPSSSSSSLSSLLSKPHHGGILTGGNMLVSRCHHHCHHHALQERAQKERKFGNHPRAGNHHYCPHQHLQKKIKPLIIFGSIP